jgi:hypothetical protein
MSVQHLFNSSGKWIAFRRGRYVWSPAGTWIGWLPWDDSEVIQPSGAYLGNIVGPNRLLKKLNRPFRGYPGYPGFPGYPGYPGYPGHAGFFRMPVGFQDVDEGLFRND